MCSESLLGFKTSLRKIALSSVMGIGCLIFMSLPAIGQPKVAGGSGDWKVYVYQDQKGRRACFMHSSPLTSRGAEGKKRGQISLTVARRPASKIYDEVSFDAGYSYKPNSKITARIKGKVFEMFTKGQHAWLRNAKDDQAMVKAMIRGNQLDITGVSARGTKTRDRFSLRGFTATHARMKRLCS